MVRTPTSLSTAGRAYVSAIGMCGLVVVGICLFQLYMHPIPYQWFLLAGLTLLSGSATVQLPSSQASISISEVFIFVAMLLYGTPAAIVIIALDGLVISFWLAKRHREFHRVLFNMSAPAVAGWISSRLFFYGSGLAPLAQQP